MVERASAWLEDWAALLAATPQEAHKLAAPIDAVAPKKNATKQNCNKPTKTSRMGLKKLKNIDEGSLALLLNT